MAKRLGASGLKLLVIDTGVCESMSFALRPEQGDCSVETNPHLQNRCVVKWVQLAFELPTSLDCHLRMPSLPPPLLPVAWCIGAALTRSAPCPRLTPCRVSLHQPRLRKGDCHRSGRALPPPAQRHRCRDCHCGRGGHSGGGGGKVVRPCSPGKPCCQHCTCLWRRPHCVREKFWSGGYIYVYNKQ